MMSHIARQQRVLGVKQMSVSIFRRVHAPARARAAPADSSTQQQQQTVLLDVMDTIIQDPFFEHMPRFFNISFKELLAAKHPTAWVEFESGVINQDQLFAKFFADGRSFDGQALIDYMVGPSVLHLGAPSCTFIVSASKYTMRGSIPCCRADH
eukprot:GHRR01025823.1.p1 GENE.GHRR01025823.1~~GHRR01025823.1.p1  ORF type:complete len:153 (+),score=19.10 GHRR01025823.1:97-555(+)